MKKPNRVPIRQFVQRVQQLNGYLHLLPCLFYSERATKLTKEVEPFDDADLASHILRMVPKHWQDQYELTGDTVPQSVRKLLEALERIEKAFPTEKERKGPNRITLIIRTGKCPNDTFKCSYNARCVSVFNMGGVKSICYFILFFTSYYDTIAIVPICLPTIFGTVQAPHPSPTF